MKILLIEDDIKTAAFVTKGLEEAGYMVSSANDGATGLQMVKETPFDLAIIDVMLPQMDGITVIEQMRAAQINTPVIVLSARNSVDDRVRGLQAGCDIYLVLPPRRLLKLPIWQWIWFGVRSAAGNGSSNFSPRSSNCWNI